MCDISDDRGTETPARGNSGLRLTVELGRWYPRIDR